MLNGDGTMEKEHWREGMQEMLAKVWGVRWGTEKVTCEHRPKRSKSQLLGYLGKSVPKGWTEQEV